MTSWSLLSKNGGNWNIYTDVTVLETTKKWRKMWE